MPRLLGEACWPNAALQVLAGCQRVLLLQGPVGPFFFDLAGLLRAHGREVCKVGFNSGDLHFFPGSRWFRGDPQAWAAQLRDELRRFRPQACVMFGQDRPMHVVARRVLAESATPVAVMVFEEGYVRPNHVTFELDGVNSRSSFRWPPPDDAAALHVQAPMFHQPFWELAQLAMRYQLLARLGRPWYPGYVHHRSLNVLHEGWSWLRAGWIKSWAPGQAARLMAQLRAAEQSDYFLVPLQVHHDSQLHHHSSYTDICVFIEDVMRSFAAHAEPQSHLVIKHHPMNRGHCSYTGLIRRLAQQLGRGGDLPQRVHYLRDGHLPSLLEQARGTVVINSTVGLSSMFHGTPVKTLGQALYDLPGLTCQDGLDAFWRHPGEVDRQLFQRFLTQLIAQTQLPGSFYWPARRYAGLLDAIEAVLTARAGTARDTLDALAFSTRERAA